MIANTLEERSNAGQHMCDLRPLRKLLGKFAVLVDGLAQEHHDCVHKAVQNTAYHTEYKGQRLQKQRAVNRVFQVEIFVPAVYILLSGWDFHRARHPQSYHNKIDYSPDRQGYCRAFQVVGREVRNHQFCLFHVHESLSDSGEFVHHNMGKEAHERKQCGADCQCSGADLIHVFSL